MKYFYKFILRIANLEGIRGKTEEKNNELVVLKSLFSFEKMALIDFLV